MDKEVIEKQFQVELQKTKYYRDKYSKYDKAIRGYEHFRKKYLHHQKMANVYSLMLQERPSIRV